VIGIHINHLQYILVPLLPHPCPAIAERLLHFPINSAIAERLPYPVAERLTPLLLGPDAELLWTGLYAGGNVEKYGKYIFYSALYVLFYLFYGRKGPFPGLISARVVISAQL
jgi:hypothetical protein